MLAVDDCLTSGKTMTAVYKLLASKGVNNIYSAVLYKNIHVEQSVYFAAQYDADREWLVFPWENR